MRWFFWKLPTRSRQAPSKYIWGLRGADGRAYEPPRPHVPIQVLVRWVRPCDPWSVFGELRKAKLAGAEDFWRAGGKARLRRRTSRKRSQIQNGLSSLVPVSRQSCARELIVLYLG